VDGDGDFSLSVHDGASTTYMTFSHVWAHGLGSTSETGLPLCQIKRLAGLASNLDALGAFWIDSLCVPKAKDLRALAIRSMADTYRKAKAVLVLDRLILDGRSTDDRKENLLRIQLSSWMRRLWTLQEAILSSKVFFQFSDNAVLLDDIAPSFMEQIIDPVLAGFGLPMSTLRSKPGDGQFNITDVLRASHWRSTSKKEDESIAIGSLCNVDTGALVNASPKERMKAFYLMTRILPRDIIFLALPKLQDEGFRWAPATFLTASTQSIARHDVDAICSETGLTAAYYALRFDTLTIEEQERVLLISSTKGDRYLISLERPKSGAYRCNGLLMSKLPEFGVINEGVVVLCESGAAISSPHVVDPPPVACVFQRRLAVVRLPRVDGIAGIRSAEVKFQGRLKVCIS
jgi:hypothetical protein